MSAGDVHSILYRGDDPVSRVFRPKILDAKKPQRYWPGKVPTEEEDELVRLYEEQLNANQPTVIDSSVQDRRLQRVEQSGLIAEKQEAKPLRVRSTIDYSGSSQHGEEEEREECSAGESAKEISRDENLNDEEEPVDDEDIVAKRERMRSRLLARRQQEEVELANLEEDDEEYLEEISEEDSDYDEDDPSTSTLLKPIFVPKDKRETYKEKEELELLEQQKDEREKRKREERKLETRQMVMETVKKEEEVEANGQFVASDDSETELPNDDDAINEEEEYEMWKVRELKRIKRDREAREFRKNFLAEVEKRRLMTDLERRQDDKQIDADMPKVEKKYKLLFMQKYYHKGAFFQDKAQDGTEELYLRDVHAPVGEDAMDKKILPKAMRLRRGQFGRAGQVKHTHLVDVDTTDFSIAWAQNDSIRSKYQSKMAGLKGEGAFSRPVANMKK